MIGAFPRQRCSRRADSRARLERKSTDAGIPIMSAPIDTLTHVELIWLEKQIEHWIRFGRDVAEQIVDRRQRILSFEPDSTFAFVRWAGNDYGTVVSRIDILRAVALGEPYSTVGSVRPGGDILAHLWLAEGRARAAGDRRHRATRHRSGRGLSRSLAARSQPARRR